MKKESLIERLRPVLFSDISDLEGRFTDRELQTKQRLMLSVTRKLDRPLTTDKELVDFLMTGCNGMTEPVSKSQAYRDVAAVTMLSGDIQPAAKNWMRHMIVEGAKAVYDMAMSQKDAKGAAAALDKLTRPYSKAFLPYAWGLYVTAYARDRLFKLLECCRLPLYCDTDSGKGCDWDHDKLDKLNAVIERKSRDAGFVALDRKGREHVIGVFENELDENVKCVRFSALHAKCYGYELSEDGGMPELHTVIAGVTADNGQPETSDKYITREKELGKLECLHDGARFVACGGTRSDYLLSPHDVIVNGELIHSYGGCAILPTTYEIGGTVDLLAAYLIHQ